MFYDTHAHLNTDAFNETYEQVIKEARSEGVKYINVVGFDRVTNQKAYDMALKYDDVFATSGLHPVDAHLFNDEDYKLLENYLKEDIVKAVGECGLDYHWHKDTKEKQFEVFKKQIELSKMYQKPLIIHVRDAMNDAYELLKEASKDGLLEGVMHCFSGSSEMAKRFLDLGLYISLGGPVTFKNAKAPKEVAEVVPLDKLLIETDCPYLAPHPYRGKQNKPSYVPLVAKAISDIKGIELDKVGRETTKNALKLFKIE